MKEPVRAVVGGVSVGIANVIPGVSGGTMMAITNIFDRTMTAISDVFKKKNDHRGKDILFLVEVLIGAAVGIVGFSKLLEWMFGVIPMPTVFLFVGLVACSVPVFRKQQMKDVRLHPAAIAIGVAIIAAMTVAKCVWFPEQPEQLNAAGEVVKETWPLPDFNFVNCLILMAAGAVSGFAMLLPGISGSLVLMILGMYEYVWFQYVNNISEIFKNFSIDTIVKFIPMGFMALGILIGIVVSAKLTKWALKKNATFTLNLLIGLVGASAVSILAINTMKYTADPMMIVGSVAAFAIGGGVVLLLGKFSKE